MRRIRLAGQLAEPISHYTDGVEAGGFLYVSGMLPLDANGDLVGVGDVVRQAEQVLDNVGEVLRAAGATFDDVVRVGVYLLNVADRPAVNTVRRRYFGGPASEHAGGGQRARHPRRIGRNRGRRAAAPPGRLTTLACAAVLAPHHPRGAL